jgi:hypothetical protein
MAREYTIITARVAHTSIIITSIITSTNIIMSIV